MKISRIGWITVIHPFIKYCLWVKETSLFHCLWLTIWVLPPILLLLLLTLMVYYSFSFFFDFVVLVFFSFKIGFYIICMISVTFWFYLHKLIKILLGFLYLHYPILLPKFYIGWFWGCVHLNMIIQYVFM